LRRILPIDPPRDQFTDPVDGVSVGDPGENVPEIGFGIQSVQFCGLCRAPNYAERSFTAVHGG